MSKLRQPMCRPYPILSCLRCTAANQYFPAETALCVLSFFFWIVGVVLYAVNVSTKPIAARAYLKWGLISVAVNVGLSLLVMLIPLLLTVSSA